MVICVNCGRRFNKQPHKIRASAFDFCCLKCNYEYKRNHQLIRGKRNDQSMLRVFKTIGARALLAKQGDSDE
jgi:hypothetical protein